MLPADYAGHSYGPDEVAVVVVPVYGGHVAPLAALRLQSVKGDSTPCVAIVVYGNRAYEHALEELQNQLSSQGFSVVACATFVGEHSYSTDAYPVSKGRPNADDLALATSFGKGVADKIAAASDREHLYEIDSRTIKRPKQPIFPLIRFMYSVVKLRKSNQPIPKTPVVDESKCTHCGTCVQVCPNDAIALGDELHTQADACIRCCACVKSCPHDARAFQSPFGVLLSRSFNKEKQPQVLL